MTNLTGHKAKLFQLNLSVHSFLADLGATDSNNVNENHIDLAEELKEEVVNLYSLWDICHHQTAGSLSRIEEAIKKLHEFEHELLELRSALQTDSLILNQRSKKKCVTSLTQKQFGCSGDSGISDGSCGILSDYDLPEKHQRFSKLKIMAKSLEETLSPKAPALLMISKTLEATSNELNDLQKNYISYKSNSRKGKKRTKLNLGVKNDKEKFRPKAMSASRRRRFAKITIAIQAFMIFLEFPFPYSISQSHFAKNEFF